MVAAANTGGGGYDPAEELKGYRVAFEILAKAVKSASGPADELYRVQSHLSATTLPAGSFGPSDPAGELVKYWNKAIEQRVKELTFVINDIYDMADKLDRTINTYLEAEEKNEEEAYDAREKAADHLNDSPREPYRENPGLLRPGGK